MKERSKESKEEIQKEDQTGLADSREDLRVDFDAFLRFFNQSIRDEKSNIAMVAFLSKGYRHRLQAIVNSYNTKTALITAVQKMLKSDFLNGRKDKGKGYRFKASLIWLLEKDENFEKTLSGYYDNPDDADKTPEEIRAEQEEQRRRKMAEQRALARQIEEEDRERDRLQRERMARNAVTPEEAERQGIKLQFISKIMAEEPPNAKKGKKSSM